jgi:hypothetical protein
MGAKAKITRGKTSGRAKPAAAKPTKKTSKAAKPTKNGAAKPAKAVAKPTKASTAKPAKSAAAKPAKAAAKPATKGAAKPASKAKKAATPPVAMPTPPSPAAMPDALVDDSAVDIADDADAAKKPGALARFGRGVGSLLAKVTGRGKKKPVDDEVPNQTTIEIVTEDIVATKPAGTKPPPPPGVDD